jgi:hypothetical protein
MVKMSLKLDVELVRDTLLRLNLANEVDLLQQGYTLKYLGGGLFRNVYRIVGTKLVVKVPIGARGRRHSQGEMRAYNRIKRGWSKYAAVYDYLPDILAYNKKTGVILMPEYRPASKKDGPRIEEIGKLARVAMGKYCDLHIWNVGKGKLGDFRILDLGYFVHRVKPKPRVKTKPRVKQRSGIPGAWAWLS